MDCDCEGARQLMPQVLKGLAIAVAIISLMVPVLKILRIAIAIAKAARQYKKIEGADEAVEALEDASKSGRTIEGVYQRVDDWILKDLAKDSGVVIKP